MSSLATSSGSGGSKEFQVGGKYRLVRRIGSGSFGDIYLGVNVTNGEVSLCGRWLVLRIPRVLSCFYVGLVIRVWLSFDSVVVK